MVLVESVDSVVLRWFRSCWAKCSLCCLMSTNSCFAFKSDSAVAKYDLNISSCNVFHSTRGSISCEVSANKSLLVKDFVYIFNFGISNYIGSRVGGKKNLMETLLRTIVRLLTISCSMVDVVDSTRIFTYLIPSPGYCWRILRLTFCFSREFPQTKITIITICNIL